MLPEPGAPTAAPSETATPARQPFIDALRGFALFGILLVNMAAFAHPLSVRGTGVPRGASDLDAVAAVLIQVLAEGKFYALFATLFGLGFALQLGRAGGDSTAFTLRFLRRLAALFVFGILHGLLIWAGDILTTYAVLGVLLLLFAKVRPRTMMVWAAVFLGASVLLVGAVCLGWRLVLMLPEASEAMKAPTFAAETNRIIDEGYRIYATGSFGEVFRHRAYEFMVAFFTVVFVGGGQIFALLLVGMRIGQGTLFAAPERHAPLFTRAIVIGLAVAVPANAALVWGYHRLIAGGFGTTEAPLAFFAASVGGYFGGPALATVYVSALALGWRSERARAAIALLAPAGRMALTNYLMQSIVLTTLFYSYGFGLFGRVGAAEGVLLAVVVFAFQVVLSHVWLKRFAYGPMEWCWRAVTWLRLPPMRKSRIAPAPAHLA